MISAVAGLYLALAQAVSYTMAKRQAPSNVPQYVLDYGESHAELFGIWITDQK